MSKEDRVLAQLLLDGESTSKQLFLQRTFGPTHYGVRVASQKFGITAWVKMEKLQERVYEILLDSSNGALDSYQGSVPLEMWAGVISLRLACQFLRRDMPGKPRAPLLPPRPTPVPGERHEHTEFLDDLDDALRRLDGEDMTFLRTVYWDQKSHAEVARILGKPDSYVSTYAPRAQVKLREFLTDFKGESSGKQTARKTCLTEEQLAAYLLDNDAPSNVQESHVADCPSCAIDLILARQVLHDNRTKGGVRPINLKLKSLRQRALRWGSWAAAGVLVAASVLFGLRTLASNGPGTDSAGAPEPPSRPGATPTGSPSETVEIKMPPRGSPLVAAPVKPTPGSGKTPPGPEVRPSPPEVPPSPPVRVVPPTPPVSLPSISPAPVVLPPVERPASATGTPALALARAGLTLDASDPAMRQIRFFRVHLKNGNFIDGQVTEENGASILMQMPNGEIAIRRDLIDRVEFIRPREKNENPAVVKLSEPSDKELPRDPFERPLVYSSPPPPATAPASPDPPKSDGVVVPPPPPASEAIGAKVEALFIRLQTLSDAEGNKVLAEMANLGEEAAVYLARSLESMDAGRRRYAGLVLGRVRSRRALPILVELLAHKSPFLRSQVVTILGRYDDPSVAEHLVPFLQDAEPTVRKEALAALQALGARDSFRPIARLCADPDPAIRDRALLVLMILCQKHDIHWDLVPTLESVLDRTPDPALKVEVVKAIAASGKKEAGRLLVRLLYHEEPEVRRAACQAAAKLEAKEATEAVLSRLSVEMDKQTRLQLAGAASALHLMQAVEPLIAWLEDPDRDVAQAAHKSLRALTARDFGLNAAQWLSWCNAAKLKKPMN